MRTNRRILIIDDNRSVLEAFEMILGGPQHRESELEALAKQVLDDGATTVPEEGPAPFELTCCTQGEEAASIARDRNREGKPFAIAFVDVRMPPGWDGITTIEHLWRHDPRLQVVICSAYSDYSWREIANRLGRNDNLLILKKPFDTIEVQQLAESLAQKWSLAQANEQRLHELHQASRRLQMLIDNSLALIWQKDIDGRYIMVNRPFCERVGLSEDDIIGHTDYDLFPDAAREIRRRDELALKKGLTEEEESDPRYAGDGVFLTVRFTLPDEANQPQSICGMANDITARRSLERQLRQSHKMEAIGRLAGGIAHDFNNLLTAIMGFANISVSMVGDDDRLRRPLDEIVKASTQASNLTKQLLAYSRQQVLTPTVCDLNSVIDDLLNMLTRLVGSRYEIAVHRTTDELPVRLDPTQLSQVLINLVVNARDAMPDGGTITVTTRLSESGEGCIDVADHGLGMDEATQERIFDPFFTTKEAGKGTGLGLATVQGIVEQSGGRIAVRSSPDAGTVFTIAFSLAQAAGSAPNAHHDDGDLPPCIMVVDDVPPVRDLAADCLQRAGYRVLTPASPAAALDLAADQTQAIDLLLTDVVMPGMKGTDMAAEMLRLRPDLQVIYMSGYADTTASHLQPRVFLQKPFTINDLLRRIRDLLGDRALTG